MQSLDGEERELPTINKGEDFGSSQKPSEENLSTRAEVSTTNLTATSPDTKGPNPSIDEEVFRERPSHIADKKETACEYCGGKNRGHSGSCPVVTGLFGFNKDRKHYAVETTRYSGDLIREYVKGYNEEEGEYMISKIEFEDKKGRVVTISDLLPSGIKLARKNYSNAFHPFWFDEKKNTVHYEKPADKGNLITLLHEIGHAQYYAREPSLRQRLRGYLGHIFGGFFLPDRVFYGQIAESERSAWAFALRIDHKLGHQGIILEPDFDVQQYMKFCLNDHYKHDVKGRVTEGSKLDAQLRRKFKVFEGP